MEARARAGGLVSASVFEESKTFRSTYQIQNGPPVSGKWSFSLHLPFFAKEGLPDDGGVYGSGFRVEEDPNDIVLRADIPLLGTEIEYMDEMTVGDITFVADGVSSTYARIPNGDHMWVEATCVTPPTVISYSLNPYRRIVDGVATTRGMLRMAVTPGVSRVAVYINTVNDRGTATLQDLTEYNTKISCLAPMHFTMAGSVTFTELTPPVGFVAPHFDLDINVTTLETKLASLEVQVQNIITALQNSSPSSGSIIDKIGMGLGALGMVMSATPIGLGLMAAAAGIQFYDAAVAGDVTSMAISGVIALVAVRSIYKSSGTVKGLSDADKMKVFDVASADSAASIKAIVERGKPVDLLKPKMKIYVSKQDLTTRVRATAGGRVSTKFMNMLDNVGPTTRTWFTKLFNNIPTMGVPIHEEPVYQQVGATKTVMTIGGNEVIVKRGVLYDGQYHYGTDIVSALDIGDVPYLNNALGKKMVMTPPAYYKLAGEAFVPMTDAEMKTLNEVYETKFVQNYDLVNYLQNDAIPANIADSAMTSRNLDAIVTAYNEKVADMSMAIGPSSGKIGKQIFDMMTVGKKPEWWDTLGAHEAYVGKLASLEAVVYPTSQIGGVGVVTLSNVPQGESNILNLVDQGVALPRAAFTTLISNIAAEAGIDPNANL